MPDPMDPPQEYFPIAITDTVSTCSSMQLSIAEGSEITSALEAAITENALIFSEIDRLLATATTMAQYYQRSSVGDAIVLAMRINRMDYEGRRFELTRLDEQL